MEEFDPIDVDDQQGAAGVISPQSTTQIPASGTAIGSPHRNVATGNEQVIPIVKEELSVGKRATERRYRVRTHVVEKSR